jgi:Skp family chaperone for outer membrane proteins
MKKLLIAATVAGSVLTASVMASPTIGIINMQVLMTSAPQVQDCQVSLKKKFTPVQNKLQADATTLQADMKNLQKNGSTMSKADLSALENKVQSEQAAFQQGQANLQQQAMEAQQACMTAFAGVLKTAAAQVADKNDMSVVLPSNAVIYYDSNMDITDAVIAKLKK